MPDKSILHFPPQKLSSGKKTEKWGIKCIEAAEDLAIFRYSGVRESHKNKQINYNLANDILDTSDLEKVCNPMGIKNATFPATMHNYPIANPKIDLLVGEERKRRFDWHARVVNDDAITDKEDAKKKEIFEFIQNKIHEIQQREAQIANEMMENQLAQMSPEERNAAAQPPQGQGQAPQQQEQAPPPQQPQGPPPQQGAQGQQQPPAQQAPPTNEQEIRRKTQESMQQQLEEELAKLDKYLNYEFQDVRERMATHILNYLYKTLDLKEVFSRGFEDALIAGEEIYATDIIAGEPILRKCNPLNVHTFRSGESAYINDSDIIIEDEYFAPGMVIDDFHEELTPEDIKNIDDGTGTGTDGGMINIGNTEPNWMVNDGLIDTDAAPGQGLYGQFWDTEGNIRVTRVVWKSLKKIGELIYYDQDTGEKLETIVPEDYRVNKDTGEEVKWLWINEWWEGTRIGKDIYVKIQPRPIQFRSMTNLSKCQSGYVGMAYNINSSKAKSLMDRMKPYQYLYNVLMYRTELAFAKSKGRIGTLDLATVPDHWTVDKWMYYAEVNNWAVKDSFKEAKKGAAQGKLAGQMNQNSPVLDMDMGNYIQQHVQMLQFVEMQLGKISGVSDQRQGQIENRELVGNVNRSVTQSSHITEKWFSVHDHIKKDAMAVLLETAKYCYKTKKDKRIQYVLDDMSTSTLELDGQQFNEADYGNFSQIMDMYMNPSIASMRRNIEKAEQEKMQRDQEAQAQQQQMQQQQQQAQQQAQQAAQNFEMAKMDKEHANNIQIQQMKMAADFEKHSKDLDNDGIPDVVEVDKIESNERIKTKELMLKAEVEREKLDILQEKNDIEREKLGLELDHKDRDRDDKARDRDDKAKATETARKDAKDKADKEERRKDREMKVKERIENKKLRAKPKPTLK